MEKISVIIPVYQVENYFEACIRSVLNQTYRNLEVLLIDDGSKDSSGRLCDEYAKKDERIRVIHQENQGLAEARNVGLSMATGEWISFVDSDDYLHPGMYEELIKSATQDVDLILCRYREVLEDGETRSEGSGKISIFSGEELMTAYLFHEPYFNLTPSVWDRLYKRKVIGNIRFSKGFLSEDIEFTPKVFMNSKKAIFYEKELYYYRGKRTGSITNSGLSEKMLHDSVAMTRKAIAFLEEKGRKEWGFWMKFDFYFLLSDWTKKEMEEGVKKQLLSYRRDFRTELKEEKRRISPGKKKKIRFLLDGISPGLRKWVEKIVFFYQNRGNRKG